jgi:hypothetical protein
MEPCRPAQRRNAATPTGACTVLETPIATEQVGARQRSLSSQARLAGQAAGAPAAVDLGRLVLALELRRGRCRASRAAVTAALRPRQEAPRLLAIGPILLKMAGTAHMPRVPGLSLRRPWRTLAVVRACVALLSPPWWTPRAYLAYVLTPQPASQALSAGRPTAASAP